MHPLRIYGHTDDLDMMLFITVGLWFVLRVVLEPLSADIAITFSTSGYLGVVFCPVRDAYSRTLLHEWYQHLAGPLIG